jgi:glycosyltransferase involved in cell wall biosynthesis
MTVFGDLRFLDEAVDSVLRQDFSDFELIVVDDGTGEEARFRALQQRDPRIRLVVNPTNLGTAAAANRGIAAARADIIARLDADDIAEPARLGRLVGALAEDPELGLVGSWCATIDESGRAKGMHRMPPTDPEIRWTILFHSPFIHSTVAYRRECFEVAGGYRPEELVSQDHYLWFEMLPHCRARNIPESLARYRHNRQGLSAANARNARMRTHPIREKLWADLGLTYDLHDDVLARRVSDFLRGAEVADPGGRIAVYRMILKVLRAFLASPRPLAREEDKAALRKMTRTIINRMLASPPDRLVDVLALGRLCWPIAKKAAIAAVLLHVPRTLGAAWASKRSA